MHAIKSDGFALDGTNYANNASQAVRLWCTEAVTATQWIAEHATDTTNPAGTAGNSYRIADADNADAEMGTVGVALETTTAAGFVMVQIRGRCASASVSSAGGPPPTIAVGDDLVISSTSGMAGEYADATSYNLRLLGRCVSVPASNLAAVELYVHPKFAE